MRPPPFAFHHHPRALAKIHLGFLPRLHFHPHKGHGLRPLPLPHEALHRIVTTGKLMFGHQILIEALGRQPA